MSINQVLDKDYHRARDINIKHPEASVYEAVKLQANAGTSVEVEGESVNDDIAIPVFFDGDLDDLDW